MFTANFDKHRVAANQRWLVNEAIFESQTITYFAAMIKIILIHLFTGSVLRFSRFVEHIFGEFKFVASVLIQANTINRFTFVLIGMR